MLDKLVGCIYTVLMKLGRDDDGKLVSKPRLPAPLHKAYKAGDTVRIEVRRDKCKFLTPYPSQVYSALSVPVPGYLFTPSYKNKMWDGRHKFITKAGYFPVGLLPVICAILTTGNNPLIDEDKDDYKVLANPVQKVSIALTDEVKKHFHPSLVYYYISDVNILQYLNPENGEFIYPTKILLGWKEVREVNPLARQILDLAKSLRK
jgi:hypothetical protein